VSLFSRHPGYAIRMLPCRLLALCVFAIGAAHAAPSDNWAQWRGPDGLGVAASADFPLEWAAATAATPAVNIAWKTPVEGRGHSSPIVWGNRLFITTSIQHEQVPGHKAPDHLNFDLTPGYIHPDSEGVDYKNTLKVLAFDTQTGKLLWDRVAYDGLMYDNRHKKNTYASSTSVTDGRLVYAFFEAAGLYAYTFDGKLEWKASLGNIAKAGMGPGTSPVLYENLIILQVDQEMGAGSAIVALDKQNGKEVWRADRKNRRSWATPLIVRTPSRVELVASGAEAVIAYDPLTGKELWRAPGVSSHPIPSAVAGHGLVFLSAGSSAKRSLAIRAGGTGELKGSDAILWRHDRGTAYVPSPILFGDNVYVMSDAGLITCLDARTGKMHYEGGRPPVGARFTASLVAFGDRLLQTSEDGDTFVIKAGPAHEVLRTNSVGEPVYASLALAGGTIYIRGTQHLFAIRKARS
jgi:outer membrane protein assembly factor BamB